MKFTKTVIAAALAIGTTAVAHADGVEWSGFGSLYYSQAMDNNNLAGGARNNKPDYTSNSLLGLNVGSKLSDEFSVASQIIMAGDNAQASNFNMFAQFAYLNWKPMDGLSLKIGRQLWPVLISSEYQRVHFLLPQSQIPSTTYRLLPFISFDGISANKTFETAVGALTVGAYTGNPKLNSAPIVGIDTDFQTMMGARVTLDGSGWRLHATANRIFSKVSINSTTFTAPTTVTGNSASGQTHSNIFSLGYRYDKYNFVSWGEAMYSKATDDQNLTIRNTGAGVVSNKKLFEKSYGGYVLAGYRFGKFLPSVTYTQGTTYLGLPASSPSNAKYEGKTTSYIVGVAYAINDTASFKTEYLRTYAPSVSGAWYDLVQSTTSTKKFGDAVKAGVDFIF